MIKEIVTQKNADSSLCQQAVLPGLVTGLTGFSYAPCLFNNGAVGAIAGATGIGISPKIFNYGALALMYLQQSTTEMVNFRSTAGKASGSTPA